MRTGFEAYEFQLAAGASGCNDAAEALQTALSNARAARSRAARLFSRSAEDSSSEVSEFVLQGEVVEDDSSAK